MTLDELIKQIEEDEKRWAEKLRDYVGGDAATTEAQKVLQELRTHITHLKMQPILVNESAEPDIAERFAERQQEVNQRALERMKQDWRETPKAIMDWGRGTRDNMDQAWKDIKEAADRATSGD